MQGVPGQFTDTRDRAQFRHFPALPGVELYHAHITHHSFEPHTHEAFGIGAITAGAERFRYRGSQHIAAANSLIMMNPDELHTGQAETSDGWCYRMVYLDSPLLNALTGSQQWWFNEVVRDDPLRARQVCDLIFAIWHSHDDLSRDGLLLHLVDTIRPYAKCSGEDSATGRQRFTIVKAYLHDNYMHNITLSDLAGLLSLTPWHFQRQFTRQFHVTPHQMLMAIRLWRAKLFLAQGMPAAEVAAACGLADQSHLTRAFTRRYGITPVRYQKQVSC
ncbi:AraC family transcriptional regulator [Shimwellia pseudoproteus]|uniref:AraC family transcriptional regulator n=1 Tax=Shimwellia pseudoproteus TaxID=570012 RepID=UPI0018EBFA63|nr:AraC family transcriptional regulator [Shimwellia pseudoproteus]